ncbi:hypothetical protein FRC17_003366 [Serendipita sp. 399]|nr:hypothetical protein FRC17_003366 [Serendipita sp. 399]
MTLASLTPMVSTTSSTPFFVIPASHPQQPQPTRPATVEHYRPSFPIHTHSHTTRPAAAAAAAAVVAHKHAHHLHSIPPKQKSTKSLIIDHLLWSHTQTRLAQVAAQLGVAQLEQEQEQERETATLCAQMGYGQQQQQQRVQRRVDLVQARALKARADGFERVLAAMLSSQSHSQSDSLFPEHVRFRITLSMLMHDLFNPKVTAPTSTVAEPSSGKEKQQLQQQQRKKTRHVPDSFRALSSRRLSTTASPVDISHAQQLFNAGVSSSSTTPSRCTRHLRQSCHVCTMSGANNSNTGGIGAGLSRPTNGRLFGRERTNNDNDVSSSSNVESLQSFLRISAFLLQEISHESLTAVQSQKEGGGMDLDNDEVVQPVPTPTRAWYALLASLLTQVVLEGYLCHGWKGIEDLEILFGLGGGECGKSTKRRNSKTNGVESPTPSLPTTVDLDAILPSLTEATALLFPSSSAIVKEYQAEMDKRFHEFVTIPSGVPDLTVHLESLANKYPSEPMEVALLRFFEVVFAWKGEPELEEYKRPVSQPRSILSRSDVLMSPSCGSMTIPTTVVVQSPRCFRSTPSALSVGSASGSSRVGGSLGHSRSPSVQSSSSMVHQSPGVTVTGGPRHLPLPKTTSPSISIASLIHPAPENGKQQQQQQQQRPAPSSFVEEEDEEDEEEEEVEGGVASLPLQLFFTVPIQVRRARLAVAASAAARHGRARVGSTSSSISMSSATYSSAYSSSSLSSLASSPLVQPSLPVTPTGSIQGGMALLPAVATVDKLVPSPLLMSTEGGGLGLSNATRRTREQWSSSSSSSRPSMNTTVLGSKRTREEESNSTEEGGSANSGERVAKKALFVTTGRYNT